MIFFLLKTLNNSLYINSISAIKKNIGQPQNMTLK